MQTIVELERVSRVYQSPTAKKGAPAVSALKEVTITFAGGEFTAIAGPSGSGKSTLLNIIGTIDRATGGDVLVLGQDVSRLNENELADFRLKSLGFVFQAYNLLPVLSAVENVEYVLQLQGVSKAQARERSMIALRSVGLEAQADRRPDQLSGGQQQRVAIARAMVHDPKLVLADEITANLDSKTAGQLLDMMLDLNEKRGTTFLFSSHDPLVLSRAKRVITLKDGCLVKN